MTDTLQMLLDEGIGLYVRSACGWNSVLDSATLVAVLGDDFPIADMPEHIICPKCGGTNLEVQPDWPSKGPGRIVEPMPEMQEAPDPKTGGSL